MWTDHRVMCPINADRMANSVDPDRSAPSEAVLSGSSVCSDLFLRKLRIIMEKMQVLFKLRALQNSKPTKRCETSEDSDQLAHP